MQNYLKQQIATTAPTTEQQSGIVATEANATAAILPSGTPSISHSTALFRVITKCVFSRSGKFAYREQVVILLMIAILYWSRNGKLVTNMKWQFNPEEENHAKPAIYQ